MLEEKQIAWQNIYTSNIKGKILTGTAIAIETERIAITENNKTILKDIDTLIVNFKNIKVLIPAKEVKEGRIHKRDLRNMIGSEVRFIIYEADKLSNKAVASRKKAMERIRSFQLKKYSKGEVVYARVISVFPKCIDVECLGVDIRLTPGELEYGYVQNLRTFYQIGDKIKVVIKEIDSENGILKISHKETKDDPYKVIRAKYVEGGEYLGVITGYADNGVYVKIEQGIETVATLPNWMEVPPAPGDKVLIRIKIIHTNKRKIYSSLLKVVRREIND